MSFSFLFLWTLYSSFHGQASTVAFGIIDPVKTLSYDVLNYNNIITSANIVRYKYLANQVTELKFSIKPIISGLYEFLHDVNSSEKVGNLITGENVFYGISVLKKLATTDIGKQNIRSDKRIAYLLFEYSRIMEERLNYLYENNY